MCCLSWRVWTEERMSFSPMLTLLPSSLYWQMAGVQANMSYLSERHANVTIQQRREWRSELDLSALCWEYEQCYRLLLQSGGYDNYSFVKPWDDCGVELSPRTPPNCSVYIDELCAGYDIAKRYRRDGILFCSSSQLLKRCDVFHFALVRTREGLLPTLSMMMLALCHPVASNRCCKAILAINGFQCSIFISIYHLCIILFRTLS